MALVHQEDFDLQKCMMHLSREGELITVNTPLDLKWQLAGCAKKMEGTKPVFFPCCKNENGEYPLLIGLYWNRSVLASFLGCSNRELPFLISEAIRNWQVNPVDPVVVHSGPANEVVENDVDLSRLPVPTHALRDGGPYLSCCVVVARDPDTGVRNASVHRMMVVGKNRLTILMDEGRHLRDYFERAERKGQALEITINNGVDPTVYLAATTPSAVAPIDRDELGISCSLRGKPLKLLVSKSVSVEGIANAQFILEGRILPHIREPEGPFAELTGYYGQAGERWVVDIQAITRRQEPIFQSLLPGREIIVPLSVMGEASLFNYIKQQVSDLTAVRLTDGGCGRYHAVLQLKKSREGIQKNAILVAFAALPALQMVTVVDDDVNIDNPVEVEWALCTRLQARDGLIMIPGAICHELNPATLSGIGNKIGFDATVPYPRKSKFEKVRMQDVNLKEMEIEGI